MKEILPTIIESITHKFEHCEFVEPNRCVCYLPGRTVIICIYDDYSEQLVTRFFHNNTVNKSVLELSDPELFEKLEKKIDDLISTKS